LKSVLVVGAGIFGTHSAIELAKLGIHVTLVEGESEILSGTSGNSILRIHSGLHYPRDSETAIQSQNGYAPFVNHYSDCIRMDFNNFYGLARKNSKSSRVDIESIASAVGIQVESVNLEDLAETGIDLDLLDVAWKVTEGVLDLDKTKDFYISSISHNQVNLLLNQKINTLNLENGRWHAYSGEHKLGAFDFVIRATHGRDSIRSNIGQISNQLYEFHLTSMLEISAKAKPFGMTVLDGEFISFLPAGDTERFLVYGPGVSILDKFVGTSPPVIWEERLILEEKDLVDSTIELLGFWFPGITSYEIIKARNAIRSVQSGVTKSDKRVTQVSEIAPKFYDLKSTKIDHVIEVGHLIRSKILDSSSA
jgi:hypothetical protein